MLSTVPFWMRPRKTVRLASLYLMFMVAGEALIMGTPNRDNFHFSIVFQL